MKYLAAALLIVMSYSSTAATKNPYDNLPKYNPWRNATVSPDGTYFDNLTGKIIKMSEHPLPNYGYPVQAVGSGTCDTTYVQAVSQYGDFLITDDDVTLHISDGAVAVSLWLPGSQLRICGYEVINIDDNTSATFDRIS